MRSTKIKNVCSSSLWTCLHNLVILRNQNRITRFFYDFSLGSHFTLAQHKLFAKIVAVASGEKYLLLLKQHILIKGYKSISFSAKE